MKTRVLVRNIVANWLGFGINLAVAFVMSPFLVHRLGDTMYGLWVLLLAVTGYMGLLDAGLKVSVVKYVSRYHATNDMSGVSRVVSTVLALHGTIGIVIVGLAVLLSPLLPGPFAIPADTIPLARVVLIITAVNLAISMVASVFNGVLAGLQRYDYSNIIGVGMVVFRSVLIVVLVSKGYGIIALGLVHTVTQILAGLLTAGVVFRTVKGLTVGPRLVTAETVKLLYSFGSFVLLNNFAMFFLFNSGEIVTGIFLGTAAVTYYAIAGSLLQYLSQIIGVMTQVLHPYASEQEAKGDTQGLQQTVVIGTKACLVIALPVTVTFMLIGRDFIRLWMGPTYADVAAPLLIVLAIGRVFWLSQSSAGNVLLGAGRHKLLTMTNLLTGGAGLLLGTLLLRSMGLLGLALGMTIPMVITQGFILPRLTIRTFSIPPKVLLREGYLQPVLATVPYGLFLAGLMVLVKPATLVQLASTIAAALPLLAITIYFVCLSAAQRMTLRRVFTDFRPSPMLQGPRRL